MSEPGWPATAEADLADGKAGPGAVSSRPEEPLSGPPMRILAGDLAPTDAFVAVQYNNRWFWIADTDIQSKTTFAVVMLLFSISETGIKGGCARRHHSRPVSVVVRENAHEDQAHHA